MKNQTSKAVVSYVLLSLALASLFYLAWTGIASTGNVNTEVRDILDVYSNTGILVSVLFPFFLAIGLLHGFAFLYLRGMDKVKGRGYLIPEIIFTVLAAGDTFVGLLIAIIGGGYYAAVLSFALSFVTLAFMIYLLTLHRKKDKEDKSK